MTDIKRGLEGVVLTETRTSMVDGQRGTLIIRGFPVEELAPKATFEETLYLLWNDKLPNARELESFREQLASMRQLPNITIAVLKEAAEANMDPMDALRIGVDTLSLVKQEISSTEPIATSRQGMFLAACLPTIVASYWCMLKGKKPVPPRHDLSQAGNYMYMLTGQEPSPDATHAVDTYWNTVVDHGTNASTFAARVITSTRSDIISAIVGAVGALKGSLHGGAPGPALDMVFEIRKQATKSGRSIKDEAETHVRNLIQGGGRIMGFGHRVYKVRDPRADVLADAARLLSAGVHNKNLYDDALIVEDVVLKVLNELKPGHKLKTNVEFYTALLLHGLGFETALFTPTFALGRIGGWIANVLEQVGEDHLIRPDAIYVGPIDRKWISVEERK